MILCAGVCATIRGSHTCPSPPRGWLSSAQGLGTDLHRHNPRSTSPACTTKHTQRQHQSVLCTYRASVCMCVLGVGVQYSLGNSDGGFLSVDRQLILKAFHFSPHLWDVKLLHDDYCTQTCTHRHLLEYISNHILLYNGQEQSNIACLCLLSSQDVNYFTFSPFGF